MAQCYGCRKVTPSAFRPVAFTMQSGLPWGQNFSGNKDGRIMAQRRCICIEDVLSSWSLSPRNTGTTVITVENPADGEGKGGEEVE